MKDLLHDIVAPLVSEPGAIEIRTVEQGNTTVLELRVAPGDVGKVIGKGGRRAKAIRSVIKARATVEGRRVLVDIL